MDIIRLKVYIKFRLGIAIANIMLINNPTVRTLAAALAEPDPAHHSPGTGTTIVTLDSNAAQVNLIESSVMETYDYDPVVVLNPIGTKTPFWLVHLGLGEVLVFVGLAQHLVADDCPVYALRVRGFESGQNAFISIPYS